MIDKVRLGDDSILQNLIFSIKHITTKMTCLDCDKRILKCVKIIRLGTYFNILNTARLRMCSLCTINTNSGNEKKRNLHETNQLDTSVCGKCN